VTCLVAAAGLTCSSISHLLIIRRQGGTRISQVLFLFADLGHNEQWSMLSR